MSKLHLTRKELAKRWNCNEASVIYRERRGDITGRKLNGRYRYKLEDVILVETQNPINPLNQAAGKLNKKNKSIIWKIKATLRKLLR